MAVLRDMITAIMATIQQITTARQLLDTPDLGRCELVRGELIMRRPAGFEHGRIVADISAPLARFVEQRGLGVVTGSGTGFLISRDPDTVRAPDVGFVRAERVSPAPTKGFFQGPPDLAVEVLSPDDRASQVLAKVHDWLAAGCRAVWVVDPEARTVSVYRSRDPMVVRSVSDELTGDDVLPEFRLPVAEIFAQ
jgi:Uma2 family endonuclease